MSHFYSFFNPRVRTRHNKVLLAGHHDHQPKDKAMHLRTCVGFDSKQTLELDPEHENQCIRNMWGLGQKVDNRGTAQGQSDFIYR